MPNKFTGKLRGMYTDFVVTVNLEKSLSTGEKRYVPLIGGKSLRLSFKTRTLAEVYGNLILIRYEEKIEVQNKLIREAKEKSRG